MCCHIYQFGRGWSRSGFLYGISSACRCGFDDTGCWQDVIEKGEEIRRKVWFLFFNLKEKKNVPGQRQQIEASKYLLSEGYELSSLETVEEYFRLLYQHKGENLDNKKIMEEFQNGKYNFAKVGEKFHFIEENTKTVFIPKEEEAVQLLLQIRRQGFTKSGIRKAGQY